MQLSLLFTDMYNYGYIPDCLLTIHKGGRKSKSDPNNYRAITHVYTQPFGEDFIAACREGHECVFTFATRRVQAWVVVCPV